jgi:signal transduction histidine kinase
LSNGGLTVVAIDDDDEDLLLVGRYLDDIPRHHIDFFPATTLDEGLRTIQDHGPDVILVDYYLGSQTGLDAIAEIRDHGCPQPILMLTGMGHEELAVTALKSGAADYIPKIHLSPASLGRSIDNALEKFHLQQTVDEHQRSLESANRDLTRRNEEIRNFYHTLSHEMKTPLTSAREFVSIVLDGLAGDLSADQIEYLGYAKDSCDQLVRHLSDLLDVARLETGKLRLDSQEIDLATSIHAVVTSKRIAAEQAGVGLDVEIASNLPTVLVDPQRIRQVLTNLVDNAIKFTESGGSVTVRVEAGKQSGEPLSVAVIDSGCGIPQDKLSRIFDRLCQVAPADSPQHQGLGLGLNICKELIELHQGTMRAESTPGQGSVFSFSLPVSAATC